MTREQDQAAFEEWNDKAFNEWVNAGCRDEDTNLERIWHAALAYARSQKPEDVTHLRGGAIREKNDLLPFTQKEYDEMELFLKALWKRQEERRKCEK